MKSLSTWLIKGTNKIRGQAGAQTSDFFILSRHSNLNFRKDILDNKEKPILFIT